MSVLVVTAVDLIRHLLLMSLPNLPLIEGEKIIEYNPDQTQLTTWYTKRAVRFIEKNIDRRSFYMCLVRCQPDSVNFSRKFDEFDEI